MFSLSEDWNPLQLRLKEIIMKKEHFGEMQLLLLQLHSIVHSKTVYNNMNSSFLDEIWEDLSDIAFRTMPTTTDDTIAWHIWHITRIEDLTANFLMAEREQVLTQEWLDKLKITVQDTGNAMSDSEIMDLSNRIDKATLYEYRKSVGQRTKEIINNLKPEDMKRKVARKDLDRIAEAGGVTSHPSSNWLLDFWGRKNIAGIIQMPITRHQVVHLNDCKRLKRVCVRKAVKE